MNLYPVFRIYASKLSRSGKQGHPSIAMFSALVETQTRPTKKPAGHFSLTSMGSSKFPPLTMSVPFHLSIHF